MDLIEFVSSQALRDHATAKYGKRASMGWSPGRRWDFGYSLAGDVYECFLDSIVSHRTRWVDVGGGRAILPHNDALSASLAERCESLTSVDPSRNVFENPYAHEKICSMFEDFQVEKKFNLATFRMVAEHVEAPDAVIKKLEECVEPGGLVVIYTINKHSPIPIITRLTPFSWHHKIKKIFWGGQEKDTFPVAYKMNSKQELDSLFVDGGEFKPALFRYLDDVSATIEYNFLNLVEMYVWRFCQSLGLRYFENNILAVYIRK